MKLDERALIEIVSIVRNALLNGSDASAGFRALDFVANEKGTLSLTEEYVQSSGWQDADL